MFDTENFSFILKKIVSQYDSITDFSETAGVGRSYISKYIHQKMNSIPSPKVLLKIANASKGIITYEELMKLCGHVENTLENTVYEIYQILKKLSEKIYFKEDGDLYEIEVAIEKFQEYSFTLIETIKKGNSSSIYLTDYYRQDFFLEDFNFVVIFLCLYEAFLKCIEQKDYIVLVNYKYSDWFNMNTIYEKVTHLTNLELFSFINKEIKIISEYQSDLCNYIKDFSTALNLAYLSDFDSNALIDLFRKKVDIKQQNNSNINLSNNSTVVLVYGTIPAGVPMECIEDILDTEEIQADMLKGGKQYFGLKIQGDSMENEYHNGDIIICEKVDNCENGDECVVMVNGNDGTFKKVLKNESGIILQPLNPEYQPMVYTNEQIKNLPVKIIGKVVELRRKK